MGIRDKHPGSATLWGMKLILQVVSQQLGRLQDTAEKCKTLTKATEAQVSFFQQAHQLNRSH
jgi:hypothetical protein